MDYKLVLKSIYDIVVFNIMCFYLQIYIVFMRYATPWVTGKLKNIYRRSWRRLETEIAEIFK